MGIALDAAAVQSALPEGYLVQEPDLGIGGVPVPVPRAAVIAEVFRCAEFSAAGSLFEGVWFGRLYALIQPPAAFPNSTADESGYIFEMIGAEDILAQLWPIAGFPFHGGPANLTDQGAGTIWTAEAGEYVWELVAPPAPTDQGGGTFAWFHELENGNTNIWTGDQSYGAGAIGAGTLDVPAGNLLEADPLAGALGFTASQAYHFGDVDYENMVLTQHLAVPV